MSKELTPERIEQVVLEMWPMLQKSWDSVEGAIKTYSKPENRASLIRQMKAWERGQRHSPEEDRRHHIHEGITPVEAQERICEHAIQGLTLDGILEATEPDVLEVTGELGRWAEIAIFRALRDRGYTGIARRLFPLEPSDAAQEFASSIPSSRRR